MKDFAADSETISNQKNKNGEAIKILWWLLATVTGVALTGAWFWVSGITSRVAGVEASQISGVERMARFEEALKNLYLDLGKIDGRVAETNTKLDRLLESWYREAGPYKQRGTNV